MSNPRFSIVVPVYRGAETLEELHRRLVDVMQTIGATFEIILVDDGSPDDSWAVIRRLVEGDERVHGIQLMKNFGQSSATMAGLAAARGELMVTLDDDLQNPPEEIPKLLAAIEENDALDVVIGAPVDKQHAGWRNLASTALNRVSNLIFMRDASFKLTSFRMLRREVVEPLFSLNIPNLAPGAHMSAITRRIANVAVEHSTRTRGRSGYTLSKMFRLTIDKLLGFSTFPLRMLAVLGMIGVTVSMILGVIYLVLFLFGDIALPGWTTQVLLLVAISGFNFLAFGIIGEYLQQILLSVRRTPAFLVRQHLHREGKSEQACQPEK